MGGRDDLTRSAVRMRAGMMALGVCLALLMASCGAGAKGGNGLANPGRSVSPSPDYLDACAPVGGDSSSTCLRLTLEAIDTARADEGVRPMALPSDFARLSVPEQLFVAIDRERVDRGLAPFAGVETTLDTGAQRAADRAQLPRSPGRSLSQTDTEWIGAVDNVLDADFEWMYDDGPGSG